MFSVKSEYTVRKKKERKEKVNCIEGRRDKEHEVGDTSEASSLSVLKSRNSIRAM